MNKGILFDYGGTIDSNGVQWGEVLWSAYQRHGVPVTNEAFREAYVFGERALALQPLVHPRDNFLTVLQLKLGQQFDFLQANNLLDKGVNAKEKIAAIASDCDGFAAASVARAKPLLEQLSAHYPLVLVSNFYGNVEAVLEAYGIRHLFQQVVESSVVGVRKPDPQIFRMGVEALHLPATDCIAIGDSYRKDMVPAKAAGCQTIWLKGEGWETDPAEPRAADNIIAHFNELKALLLPSKT